MEPRSVLKFWFEELSPRDWWKKDRELDEKIRERFSGLHEKALAGELDSWRDTAEGRLAEVLILDQFSRNMYRDTPAAFSGDALALVLAQEAIRSGADLQIPTDRRAFLYMPFMHSESREIQKRSVELFETLGVADNLDFARRHKAIIDRFGRYPHRNAILGRPSTPEEQDFLKQPGSGF